MLARTNLATLPPEEAEVLDPFAVAYAMAWCDHLELEWLAKAHARAWGNHDLATQIVCLKRAAAIEGKSAQHVVDRRDDEQKDYDEELEMSMR